MTLKSARSPRNGVRRVLRVTAAVICRGHRILIARRSGADPLSGYWEFPGGKIHPGETQEDCLVREIKEELGMNVAIVRTLGSHEHRYADRRLRLIFFEAKPVSGRPRLIDHDGIAWVHPEGLKDYAFAPADRPMVRHIVRHKCVSPLPAAPTRRQCHHS
jgi:8-oxo-dGTP diphosphatase